MSNLQFACVVSTVKHTELLGKLVTLASVNSLPFTLTPTGAKGPTSEDLGIEELRERLTALEQQSEGPVQSSLEFDFEHSQELQRPKPPKRRKAAKKPNKGYQQLAAVQVLKIDQVGDVENSVLLVRNGRSLYLTTSGFGELCGVTRSTFDYWMKKAHAAAAVRVSRLHTPGRKSGLCAQLGPMHRYLKGIKSRRFHLPKLEDMQAVVEDWVVEAEAG